MNRAGILLLAVAGACGAQPFGRMEKLPDWVSLEANIPYDRYPATVLDIMRSRKPAAGLRPGAVVIHGGGWIRQVKERNVAGFCMPFLERGFVVANLEYRVAGTAQAPAAVIDVRKGTRWFIRHSARYGVDSRRIVVIGESAGGQLALMAGMAPGSTGLGPASRVAAVINVFGVTDLTDQLEGPNARDYARQWIPEGPGRMAMARRMSPILYARKRLPPVLTLHGDADETVPYAHATRLTQALRRAGVDTELITVPGGRHGFTVQQWNALLPRIFDFLARRNVK